MFYIVDNRENGEWSWNGKEFRPIHKHEAKGYKSLKTAENMKAKLWSNGRIVGQGVVRSTTELKG